MSYLQDVNLYFFEWLINLKIRLLARNFCEVVVDESETWVNCHFPEVEGRWSNYTLKKIRQLTYISENLE